MVEYIFNGYKYFDIRYLKKDINAQIKSKKQREILIKKYENERDEQVKQRAREYAQKKRHQNKFKSSINEIKPEYLKRIEKKARENSKITLNKYNEVINKFSKFDNDAHKLAQENKLKKDIEEKKSYVVSLQLFRIEETLKDNITKQFLYGYKSAKIVIYKKKINKYLGMYYSSLKNSFLHTSQKLKKINKFSEKKWKKLIQLLCSNKTFAYYYEDNIDYIAAINIRSVLKNPSKTITNDDLNIMITNEDIYMDNKNKIIMSKYTKFETVSKKNKIDSDDDETDEEEEKRQNQRERERNRKNGMYVDVFDDDDDDDDYQDEEYFKKSRLEQNKIDKEQRQIRKEKKGIKEIKEVPKDEGLFGRCYFNGILNTYQCKINNYYSKTFKRQINPEKLYKLCFGKNLSENNISIGLSINNSLNFFYEYNISLTVYDIKCKPIFQYICPTVTHKISPSHFKFILHNKHMYQINNNNKELEQKTNVDNLKNIDVEILNGKILKCKILNKEDEIANEIILNSSFPLDKEDETFEETITKKYHIHNINDIETHFDSITTNDDYKIGKYKFIIYTNLDLEVILFFFKNNNIEPSISYRNNIINVYITIDNIIISYENYNAEFTEDMEMKIDNVKDAMNFQNEFKEFKNKILCKNYLSYYNEDVYEIEQAFLNGPLSGNITNANIKKDKLTGIDENKAYTDKLRELEYLPTFNCFDVYKKYNNEKIENYNKYIIQVLIINEETKILFGNRFSKCYGIVLNKIDQTYFKILYVLRPSNLKKNPMKKHIDELYSKKLSDDINVDKKMKKDIVNITIGLLGKKYNNRSITHLFDDVEETYLHNFTYNTQTVSICNPDNQEQIIYLCNYEKTKILKNGFLHIKDLIYNLQSLKMFQLYQQCIKNNLNVYTIKTDCILVRNDEATIRKTDIEFSNEIGKYKIENDKEPMNFKINFNLNMLKINFKNYDANVINIVDEYSRSECDKILDENKQMSIFAEMPGCGKTTFIKNYDTDNKTLFICPFNNLSQDIQNDGAEAITYHKLFGINVDGVSNKNSREYNVDNFDVVCFDEILIYPIHDLYKVYHFVNKYKDKQLYCTGDCNQLLPIGETTLNNITDIKQYRDDIINILFKNRLTLKINKRLTNVKDIEKLINLKQDILYSNYDIMSIFRKYDFKIINNFNNVETTKNISYFRYRRAFINKLINIKFYENKSFGDGDYIICKKYHEYKKVKLCVNYIYTIVKMGLNNVIISNGQNEIEITLDILNKHFELPYCQTIYSIQGITIKDKITLFDCNCPHVDRNMIWTMITRATSLDNITIFEHNDTEINNLSWSLVRRFFDEKINNYKNCDKEKNRNFTKDNYITSNDMITMFDENKICCGCNLPFELFIDNGRVITNITCDRLDNKFAHLKNNCRLYCETCNRARSNNYDLEQK